MVGGVLSLYSSKYGGVSVWGVLSLLGVEMGVFWSGVFCPWCVLGWGKRVGVLWPGVIRRGCFVL